MRSGFVSLVGRPNVGKSTLINALVGYKIAITSNKAQTTRNLVQGIYNDDDSQIVFVDTPGIHKPKHKLGQRLNEEAYYSIDDVDIILFLVDATKSFGKGDNFVLKEIGSKARCDIEDMIGKKVFLELYVKTIKNWRDKEKYLRELGFYDIDE